MTIRADLDFIQDCWDKVSSEAVDFVRSTFENEGVGILVREAEKRPTLKEILQHPWILKESTRIAKFRLSSSDAFAAYSSTDSD